MHHIPSYNICRSKWPLGLWYIVVCPTHIPIYNPSIYSDSLIVTYSDTISTVGVDYWA